MDLQERSRQVLDALTELETNEDVICAYAGHEWVPAGGGLLICEVCTVEKWDDEDG